MFPLFWFVGTSPVCHNLSNSVDSTLAPWEGPIWFLFMPQHVLHTAWKIAFSRQLLNSSKERNSTISMGVLCQNLAHLTAKCFPNSYNIIIFFPGEKKMWSWIVSRSSETHLHFTNIDTEVSRDKSRGNVIF